MPTYAIGDIHGCNRTFQALLEQLPLQPGDKLVLLGDLIDRGPDSKGVVDLVFRLREYGHRVVCLRGNHEQLLLDAIADESAWNRWLINGGLEALESFGLARPDQIPELYLDFFRAMPFWYETDGFLCVHGGPDFSLADPLENEHRLLWMRRWYADIDYQWLGDRTILHGHTPEEMEMIETQYRNLETGRYLNLDNGCVYAYRGMLRSDLGRLLAFSLDEGKLFVQKCVE
ncbi:MAG: serine/threonine protein phosphatase [Bacteroidetes bacterium]|nr:MAG: serine/threonine protein phosphatase [Bacteroidota bacterium]